MKTARNITDFHVHTSISHDGISPAEDYVLLAISGNDEKIAFSEHYDYDRLLNSSYSRIEDLDFYYAEILRLRLKYGDKIQILFGIELGYDPKSCEHYAQIIEKYPFDYVINSTHNINGKDCFLDIHSKTMTKQESYYVYLKNLSESLDVKYRYDIVGHIGYSSRYSSYDDKLLQYSDFPELLDEILLKIIEKNKYLELNSSTAGCADFLPERNIVERYVELGGKLFTFGSDAHSVERYKHNCFEAESFLNKYGFSLCNVDFGANGSGKKIK